MNALVSPDDTLILWTFLVGTWGYVIGNYAAIGMVKFMEVFLKLTY